MVSKFRGRIDREFRDRNGFREETIDGYTFFFLNNILIVDFISVGDMTSVVDNVFNVGRIIYALPYDGGVKSYRVVSVNGLKFTVEFVCDGELAVVEKQTQDEKINHPKHYNQTPTEIIEIARYLSFNRGNIVKYVARAGVKSKETELEDLRKALWYLNDEIKMMEGIL
jgi:hypothetical protein